MTACPEAGALPRLAYVGDVAVERGYHGSALLYRLLEDYPPERLIVIEAGRWPSDPARRVSGVPYRTFRLVASRWARSRISRYAGSWGTLRPSGNRKQLRKLLDDFRPEAILTIAHGYSWLAAAGLAREAELPMHVIVHDDWIESTETSPWLRPLQQRQFARAYSEAASRLCVSPDMEASYGELYGASGQVLYPSWAKDCPAACAIPATYGKARGPLTGAYAGNITSTGYAGMIRDLAESLERRGGRLLLFGPHSPEDMGHWGLTRANISREGALDSRELLQRLQREADFVFAPMPFDAESANNMGVGFPSKIADYTATGLPLLVWGPGYCTAVRWARDYSPVAELAASNSIGEIDAALIRLEAANHRESLGRAARAVGVKLFSHESCVRVFREALRAGGRPRAGRIPESLTDSHRS